MAADEPENLVLKLLVEIREQIDALDTKLTSRLDDASGADVKTQFPDVANPPAMAVLGQDGTKH